MPRKYLIAFSIGFVFLASCGERADEIGNGGGEAVFVSVLPKKVNFRQDPDDDALLVPSRPFLYYGQSGEVFERSGGWVRIKCQFGEEGWVRESTSGVACITELPADYSETRLTASEALAVADDKIKEWVSGPYVVAMIAFLEDFGGHFHEWKVIYRDSDSAVDSDGAFRVVTVMGGEADMDRAVWSADESTRSFVNVETGEYIGYRLLDEPDASGRASLSFMDSDELFRGDLPKAILELPPVADGYPAEYFGGAPVVSLVLVRDTWRVAYYDDVHPVNFTITLGCGTGRIKKTRYCYEK
jgi:hypothetical protein